MNTIPRPSPHHSARRGLVSALVVHDTGGRTAEGALAWFEDPASRVSSHLVIDRDGRVFQCVQLDRAAWHAGRSALHGTEDVNDFSVGVELVDEDDTKAYPEAQLYRLVLATAELVQEFRIPLNRVVGHQHIALPPGRKVDPGPDFPWWDFLARVGRLL